MRPQRTPRTGWIGAAARPLLPIAVPLAIALIAAPAHAQHCGRYVTLPGDAALDRALGLSVFVDPAGPGSPAPADRPPGSPCDGPGCSNAPSQAPFQASADPPSFEHWAAGDLRVAAPDPARAPLPTSEGPIRPGRTIGGVFHPPRRG